MSHYDKNQTDQGKVLVNCHYMTSVLKSFRFEAHIIIIHYIKFII